MSKQPEQPVYGRQGFGRSLELTEMSDLSQVVPELPPARGDLKMKYTEVMKLHEVGALAALDGNRQ